MLWVACGFLEHVFAESVFGCSSVAAVLGITAACARVTMITVQLVRGQRVDGGSDRSSVYCHRKCPGNTLAARRLSGAAAVPLKRSSTALISGSQHAFEGVARVRSCAALHERDARRTAMW